MLTRSARRLCIAAAALVLLGAASRARAIEFHDDFHSGILPAHWAVIRSADIPRYTVDDTHGEVRLAKRVDPTHAGRQSIRLELRYPLLGDFFAEAQFHDSHLARLHPLSESGLTPGNSVRLTATFPGLMVSAVRSQEQNAIPNGQHAWVEPPGFAYGRMPSNSPSGVLSIERTGFFYSVRANGQLLTSGFMIPDTVYSLALELVNDGTIDSTAVCFSDFALTADDILFASPTLDAPPAALRAATLHATPNPAAGRVTLALELPAAASARVEVFDMQGRRVALVHDAPLPAGRHELAWESGAAPGLYLAVARVGAARLTRRLVVTR